MKVLPLGWLACESGALGTRFAFPMLRACLQNQEIKTRLEMAHIISFEPWIQSCLKPAISLNFPVIKVTHYLFWFDLILLGLFSLITKYSDSTSPNSSLPQIFSDSKRGIPCSYQ